MAKKNSNSFSKEMSDYVKRVYDGKIDTVLKDGDLETLKKKMLRSIENDTQQLVSYEKFISGLILRMPVIPVRDCRVSTALTDGTNIYFDIDFYTRLTQKERIFVLAHEVWHNALLHFLRRENRDPDVWNIATDCEINYALKKDGFVVPKGLCLPDVEDEGKCAEDIYDKLIRRQNRKKMQGDANESGDGTSGGGSGGGSSGGGSSGGSSKGYSTSEGSKTDCSGELDEQFDQHMGKDSSRDEYAEGSGNPEDKNGHPKFRSPSDKWGEKGFDRDFKPCIKDNIADKIREMVVAEAQRCERLRGSVPGCVRRIIDTICKPEVRWEELLAQFVTTCLGDRRQWLPPLRRGVYNGMYLQSRRGQKINVACIVDTSGSTTADLPKFLTELVSLLETFGRYDLTMIDCDCEVHKVETFDDSNPFPIDHPTDYEFDGGGGSDLIPAFDEIYKRGLEPSCVVVFTDGYIDCPRTNPLGIPTLFVLTSDGNEPCDWGTHIRFKDKRNAGS